MSLVGLSSCAKPIPTTVPTPSTIDTSDNQESQCLQQIYSLTHSAEYENTLTELNLVQDKSNQLAAFIEGLPELPNLLRNTTIAEIELAIEVAKEVRRQLSYLPPLPSLLPSFPLPPPSFVVDAVQQLEAVRQDILKITEPIEKLPDLSEFIGDADELQDAKQRIQNHLSEVQAVATEAMNMMQQIRVQSEKANKSLEEFQSLTNSSEYEAILAKLSQVQSKNRQLATFVGDLPELPPLPGNVPLYELEEAVEKAQKVYSILEGLPKLPPLTSELVELEALRQSILKLTEIIAELPGLPEFISGSQSLEQVRVRIKTYLGEVQNAICDAEDMMQQVRQISSGI